MVQEERLNLIFEKVIREYIKTARPVGSEFLAEKYDFGISSATIRNDFSLLEKQGFLSKPHTSGGRIPTDQGWRFYVDKILSDYNKVSQRDKEKISGFLGPNSDSGPGKYAQVSKLLSDLSGQVGILGSPDIPMFFISGIRELFSEPEFNDPADFRGLASLFDDLDDYFKSMQSQITDLASIFIGEENNFRIAHPYSVVACKHQGKEGEEIIAILGSKRMDYSRNVSLVNYINEVLN